MLAKGNQTTLIGSMPQKSAEEAFISIKKHQPTMLSWPQLPKKSFLELMIPQYSEGLPAIHVEQQQKRLWLERDDNLIDEITKFYEQVFAENLDAFAISPDYASGLHYLLDMLSDEKAQMPALKGQITGPVTFALGLVDNENKGAWFDEQLRDIVVKGLTMKALWMARELRKHTSQVCIFLDEPILSAIGTPAYMGVKTADINAAFSEIITALHDADILVGTHCCGNMDWGILAKSELDIIAFDAYFFGDRLPLYVDNLETYLQRGGMLAWGIVPTSEPELLETLTVTELKQKLDKLIELFVNKGIPESNLCKQMIFTPSCGMGSGTLDINQTERVLELLQGLREY